MKKAKLGILGVLGTLGILVFVSLFFIAMGYNNFRLSKFAKQLYDIELPEDIVVVEKEKICGKMNGNGNSMDFMACLLIKSDRSKTELEHLLENMDFSCVEDRKESVKKEVVKVDGEVIESKYGTIELESLTEETYFDNYYAMVIYDGGYSADFDIRGH